MSLREHHERKPANYWVDAGRTGKDQKARVLHEPQFFTRCAKREQRSSSQNAELENIPIKSLNDFLCKESSPERLVLCFDEFGQKPVEHGDPPSVEAIFIRDKRRLEAGSSPSPRVQVYFLTTLMRNPSEPRSEHGIPTPLDEDHPDSQRQTRNSDGNQDMDDQPSDDDMAEEEGWHDLGLRDLDEEPPARKLSMREWQALKILAHHEWENKVRLLPRDLRSRLAAGVNGLRSTAMANCAHDVHGDIAKSANQESAHAARCVSCHLT